MRGGKRRLDPRESALAFNALKKRSLLATNVSSSPEADLDVKGSAKIAGLTGFGQSVFQDRQNVRIFAAQIDVTFTGADCVGGDAHSFDGAVRVVEQQDAVLERARLGLVCVTDNIFLTPRGVGSAFPFDPSRK